VETVVIYLQQWNIRPEKATEYPKWSQSALKRLLGVPGVVEFRAYRMVAGEREVSVTYQFKDLAAWASWRAHDDVNAVWEESRAYLDDMRVELWGPSPIVPDPLKP
jgi:heme-degrading monooxygenase HmoA